MQEYSKSSIVCVSVLTCLKQTLVWAGQCLFCSATFSHARRLRWTGESVRSCITPKWCHCTCLTVTVTFLVQTAEISWWTQTFISFFAGGNKTSTTSAMKTYIVCTLLWLVTSSDPWLDTHTHLVYSCLTGHLFLAGPHLCSTRKGFLMRPNRGSS